MYKNMQKHAKAPCFDAKTCKSIYFDAKSCKSTCFWCKKTLVLMQNMQKHLCFDAKTCKNCCFCILLHQKRVFLHTFASKTENHPIWCFCNLLNKNMWLCIFCTKTKYFCIVLHQKRQITFAFNKHLCSDGKTCKNYCFCILFLSEMCAFTWFVSKQSVFLHQNWVLLHYLGSLTVLLHSFALLSKK